MSGNGTPLIPPSGLRAASLLPIHAIGHEALPVQQPYDHVWLQYFILYYCTSEKGIVDMAEQIEVLSIEEYQRFVSEVKAALVFFSTAHCSVCTAIKPKILSMVTGLFPEMALYYVDCETHADIAASQMVLSIPAIIVYFDGKETVRKVRNFALNELLEAIMRPYALFFGS